MDVGHTPTREERLLGKHFSDAYADITIAIVQTITCHITVCNNKLCLRYIHIGPELEKTTTIMAYSLDHLQATPSFSMLHKKSIQNHVHDIACRETYSEEECVKGHYDSECLHCRQSISTAQMCAVECETILLYHNQVEKKCQGIQYASDGLVRRPSHVYQRTQENHGKA